MSSIAALGANTFPKANPATSQLSDSKAADTRSAAPARSNNTGGTSGSDGVALSGQGIDLQQRINKVGNDTVDFAQNLLGSFADSLFGSAAKGATIAFDSASLETESGYGLSVQHSSGPNGTTDTAAFSLSDSSHFIGKGSITTADGQKFDFEIEVQYNYQLDAGVSQSRSGQPAALPASADKAGATAGNRAGESSGNKAGDNIVSLPSRQLPDVDFGGTLDDLFKLIGRQLHASVSGNGNENGNQNGGQSDSGAFDGAGTAGGGTGQLTLRLLKLLDSSPAAEPADSRTKAVADAYGVPASTSAATASDASPSA